MFNNENYGRDPLISNYNDYTRELEDNIKKQVDYVNRLKGMQQPEIVPYTDYYLSLEESYNGLSNDDLNALAQDAEFASLNNTLTNIIQGEMMKLVRVNINKNQDAINVIKQMTDKVNSYKVHKTETNNNLMKEMNDYLTNYSEISFKEYKALKAQGK